MSNIVFLGSDEFPTLCIIYDSIGNRYQGYVEVHPENPTIVSIYRTAGMRDSDGCFGMPEGFLARLYSPASIVSYN